MDPLEAAHEVLAHGDELLTLRDAAATVGVSKRTVASWVRRGHLRAVRIGKVDYVIGSEVLELERVLRLAANGRPRRATVS